uniref:Uncharacterized protein n=1 Tax=Myotis myotis TaxID=51298 RepID=A0A7J8ANA4_MYOMY|nr:hypothetical protein mMyoMyo1_008053 [Myotis myotis]
MSTKWDPTITLRRLTTTISFQSAALRRYGTKALAWVKCWMVTEWPSLCTRFAFGRMWKREFCATCSSVLHRWNSCARPSRNCTILNLWWTTCHSVALWATWRRVASCLTATR